MRLIQHAAQTSRQAAAERAQKSDEQADEVAYQLAHHLAWQVALAAVPTLILVGRAGLGKTHLALACYHALIDDDLRPLTPRDWCCWTRSATARTVRSTKVPRSG